jgi:hypothetical protein
MAIRDSMRDSAAAFLQPDEAVQAVIAAQTASQYVAAFAGVVPFLGLNRYRIIAVTPQRILVLDTGEDELEEGPWHRGGTSAVDPPGTALRALARGSRGWAEAAGAPPLLQGHRGRRHGSGPGLIAPGSNARQQPRSYMITARIPCWALGYGAG